MGNEAIYLIWGILISHEAGGISCNVRYHENNRATHLSASGSPLQIISAADLKLHAEVGDFAAQRLTSATINMALTINKVVFLRKAAPNKEG